MGTYSTDVIANIKVNSKDIAKSMKEAINFEDVLQRIDGMEISPQIKEDFQAAAKYYKSNFSKLNLTKWFGDTTSKILDDSLSIQDREKAVQGLTKDLKKLQTVRGKFGKDTDELRIFDGKDLERLVRSQEAIEEAEGNLRTKKAQKEAEIGKERTRGRLKNQTEVLAEATKRKITGETDRNKAVISSLGIKAEDLKGSDKTRFQKYFKAAEFMRQINDEYTKLASGDMSDPKSLKKMVKLGQQMVDTNRVLTDMQDGIIKTFDPKGDKNFKTVLDGYAKDMGFGRTPEQMQRYISGGDDPNRDPYKRFIQESTKQQRSALLKRQAEQQEVLKDASLRAVDRQRTAEEAARKAEEREMIITV